MASLPVVVVVDVDPDWRTPGMRRKPYLGDLGWKGVSEGIPRLLRLISDIKDPQSNPVRFTWLLRSDRQMAELTGNPTYVADEFNELWRARLAAGDEIGWHPHLWRYSERARVWYQETRDQDWMRECLREGHRALAQRFSIRTAKTGWTQHDNLTMRTFSDLGVEVDISALPGMRYANTIPGTDLPLGSYDWSRAPQEPYFPSTHDYQIPGNGHSLDVLEVPNWTFPVRGLRHHLRRLRNRSWRDFANAAKSPTLVSEGFTHPPTTVPFACYFHPEELIGPEPMFRAGHVATNLRTLLAACQDRGLVPRMMTASQLRGWPSL